MKKILFIGAGFLQSFIIKRAYDLGYYVYAIDANSEAIGFKYTHENEVIDITNVKECLEYAKRIKPDGVVTAATDYGIISTAKIIEELNLIGPSLKTAKIIKNKYEVRKRLYETKSDDLGQFYLVNNINDIDEVKEKVRMPLIVKPADSSGSRGISEIRDSEDLISAVKFALKASLSNKVLIEDYIEGIEYGVESIVINNKIFVLGIMEKKMTNKPFYAELGHKIPIENKKVQDKITKLVKKAIVNLGINNTAINMDVLVDIKNNVNIIDVGIRMGGNLIGSHIIPRATKYDYMGNIIKLALGDKCEIPRKSKEIDCIETRILAFDPGVIEGIPDFRKIESEYNINVFFTKKEGDVIQKYRDNTDGCGYILSDSNKNLDEIVDIINNSITRR